MFTGIIEEIGKIHDLIVSDGGCQFRVNAPTSVTELKIGDSISVDGVCLTVIAQDKSSFHVEAVEETLKKTTLVEHEIGDHVNLELPLKLNERLGGHIVLGHVDAVGIIERVETRESSWMFYIAHPEEFSKYIIQVGSVAINGVSLTVAERHRNSIGISVIPHTWNNTTFQYLQEGDRVNIEFDVLGKYVIGLLEEKRSLEINEKEFLSEKHLKELGY